ncbi:lysozyme inhibitor LprI family protein [Dyella subtropica]|uniref:lysozyme inhibitor LprI family protein n=1 Tax=Dyella subtropica TaxID=2992127 RepID=UPI00224D93B6|nr:lysozyme inhibitor LprI family protein [Dyella subtropica]
MKKMACGFVSMLLLSPTLWGTATSAQDEQAVVSRLYGLRPSYGQCLLKAGDATAPNKGCMEVELDYQDKRLNKAYQAMMAKLSPALRVKLKAEEAVWIQYRDNRCASVVDDIERPELEPLSCKVDETGKQATDMEARLFAQ